MTNNRLPNWNDIHTIVFDFDGIFTDNKVQVDETGVESVQCDRADGLGINMLHEFSKKHNWQVKLFILSKETNPVVEVRAKKIGIDCIQSVSKKSDHLLNYLKTNNLTPDGLLYLGNDLNDLPAILIAGFSVAPIDAHELVLNAVDLVVPKKGGNGFVRAFVEALIGLNEMPVIEVAELF